jgi:hypothetical protein
VIEEELRSLLTERAEAVPDNPTRSAEVRSRIGTLRRRRVAGVAAGLVLVALASLLVIRFPGSNESLPPGVPAPPYFDDLGRVRQLPGFQPEVVGRPLDGPTPVMHYSAANRFHEVLLLAWCERPGDLTVRNPTSGSTEVVRCRIPVGGHHEGALLLPPERARPLGESGRDQVENIVVEPGSAGRWYFGIAEATLPTRLTTGVGEVLAEGPRTPRGTTVSVTVPVEPPGPDVPPGFGFSVSAECVEGVELAVSIRGAELGTISCRRDVDPPPPGFQVSEARLQELGIRRGDRVPLTIRSVGRDSDQWRVFPPD